MNSKNKKKEEKSNIFDTFFLSFYCITFYLKAVIILIIIYDYKEWDSYFRERYKTSEIGKEHSWCNFFFFFFRYFESNISKRNVVIDDFPIIRKCHDIKSKRITHKKIIKITSNIHNNLISLVDVNFISQDFDPCVDP